MSRLLSAVPALLHRCYIWGVGAALATKRTLNFLGRYLVTRVGFEPTTLGLKVRRSAGLSYRATVRSGYSPRDAPSEAP